ncbi:DUF5829 family protein [Microbulbifer agarilyticus]|uniref:DUF5829 family protein n=1 Tax=Microbulbifer agarilyticus TaxID=260552 RepID=UPI001CD5289B|nr:DUF5829 family protein [Microbulbifer agarilyticus]MCA0894936.1 DUF5829 family protein [Microbulbifer agarilyticus]
MKNLKSFVVGIISLLLPLAIQAETRQVAFLNHLVVVLDEQSIRAIEDSEYLKNFVDYEKTVVTASDGTSWTGRYLIGRSTYIEFFAAGDYPGVVAGDLGMAIGPDQVGGIDILEKNLSASGAKFGRTIQKRNFDGEEVDWFHLVGMDTNEVLFWAMEYIPGYFEHPSANKEPAEGDQDTVSRERYNEDNYLNKMVRDVDFVSYYMKRKNIEEVLPLFVAAGYEVEERAQGFILIGSESEIHLNIAIDDRVGLAELGFSLNSSVNEKTIEKIGPTELQIGPGARANWKFELPAVKS